MNLLIYAIFQPCAAGECIFSAWSMTFMVF